MPGTSEKISVKEFWHLINEKLEEICRREGWNVDKATYRGYAFQIWMAEIFCAYHQGFDIPPEEAVSFQNDLKADIVLEDSARKHLLIAQCKYIGKTSKRAIDDDEVTSFFSRHDRFMDRNWVREHGNEIIQDLLGDYADKVGAEYSVDYYFVSTWTGESKRIREIPNEFARQFEKRDLSIRCHLLDFTQLKELYQRSLSIEYSVPESVELTFAEENFIVKPEPHKTVIGIVKGNELRNIYQRKGYGESLFAWNIRGYLGAKAINKEMIRTATDNPSKFFYFNNGVSAICTDFKINDNKVVAKKFQIINGAQTVGALAKAPMDKDVYVLLRLTRTKTISTDKGINRDIIRFNNTQNKINLSDFRSNDDIQNWLKEQFERETPCGWIPKYRYVPKRGIGKRRSGQKITLEELAKRRYAFLYEPTIILADPRRLWTLRSEEGLYENAFGVGGELVDQWTKSVFREALLASLFFLEIEEEAKEQKKKDKERWFFNRLKYHALALAGVYVRTKKITPKRIIDEREYFDEVWKDYWSEARRLIVRIGMEAKEEKAPTVYAMGRSTQRWERMKAEFLLNIEEV